MNGPLLARGLAGARFLTGAAMIAAPGLVTAPWLGKDAARSGTKVAVRAFGMREAFLGFLGAHVADRPGIGRRTVAAFAVLDLFDVGVSVAARRTLPATGVVGISALAGVSAVAHLAVSRQLPEAAA